MQHKGYKDSRVVLVLLVVMVGSFGCNGEGGEDDAIDRDTLEQAELDELVEAGLVDELPPPLPREELDLYEVELHRKQVADRVSGEVEGAMAPLVVAAALFAVEGPADLLLAAFPAGRLGKAAEAVKHARRHRGSRNKAKELAAATKEFYGHLPPEAEEFVRVAGKMTRAQRRALAKLAAMESPNTLAVLMRRQLVKEADVKWIASKLGSKHVDRDFVTRFTFDADFAREFTEYSAVPSWRLLKSVAQGRKVGEKERAWLARKVQGLVAERAAAKQLRGRGVAARLFGREGAEVRGIGRGVRYGRSGRSIDIAVFGDDYDVVFAEVKNWSSETWAKPSMRKRALDQLREHDAGIDEIVMREMVGRRVEGKLLMVSGRGWSGWTSRGRDRFKESVERLGWSVEVVPGKQIPDFGTVIDTLR